MNARISNLEESVQDISKHLETLDKKRTKRCDGLEMKINQKLDIIPSIGRKSSRTIERAELE